MRTPTCLTCGHAVKLTFALYCNSCSSSSGLNVTSAADIRRRDRERQRRYRNAKKAAA